MYLQPTITLNIFLLKLYKLIQKNIDSDIQFLRHIFETPYVFFRRFNIIVDQIWLHEYTYKVIQDKL